MNSPWSALLWKEWREQWLLLAVFSVALVAPPLVVSLWEPFTFLAAVNCWLFALPFMGLFVAMHIAAGEQSTGTLRFLQALPVSGVRPGAAKLLMACLTIALPIAALIGMAALWGSLQDDEALREAVRWDLKSYGTFAGIDNWYAARFLAATCGGVSFLLWMSAAGVNRSDEVRAAAVGMLVLVSVWGILVIIGYFVDRPGTLAGARLAWGVLLAAAPGGLGVAFTEVANPAVNWALVLSALVSHAGLVAWFVLRFGRVTSGRREGAAVDAVGAPATRLRFAPPRRSPLRAIVWKQFRESAPLAALGGGAILALSLAFAWAVRIVEKPTAPAELLNLTFVIWMMIGLAVSIVAGVGVFMEDLRPGVNGFWRSRPIRVDQWFAVKYLAGLAVTVILLATGAAVAAVCLSAANDFDELLPSDQRVDAAQGLAAGLLAQVGMYTAAVMLMALLRQPVYAAASAVASIIVPTSVLAAIEFFIQPERLSGASFAAIIGATIAVALAVAWQTVRRDWGWKR